MFSRWCANGQQMSTRLLCLRATVHLIEFLLNFVPFFFLSFECDTIKIYEKITGKIFSFPLSFRTRLLFCALDRWCFVAIDR